MTHFINLYYFFFRVCKSYDNLLWIYGFMTSKCVVKYIPFIFITFNILFAFIVMIMIAIDDNDIINQFNTWCIAYNITRNLNEAICHNETYHNRDLLFPPHISLKFYFIFLPYKKKCHSHKSCLFITSLQSHTITEFWKKNNFLFYFIESPVTKFKFAI